jgi:hypothetical protein
MEPGIFESKFSACFNLFRIPAQQFAAAHVRSRVCYGERLVTRVVRQREVLPLL